MKKKKNAFTLIELLIVIALILFLSGLTIPIAVAQLQGTDAEYTTKTLLNDIASYQQYSFTKKDAVESTGTFKCYGTNFANLTSQRQYIMFTGTWSDTAGCINRTNVTKTLTGNASATTSTSEIIFIPGNTRLVPNTSIVGGGSASSTTANNIITGTSTTFTSSVSTGDFISFINSRSQFAIVLAITSDTSITIDRNLGAQTSIGLNKSSSATITIVNNSTSYSITITDEGQIFYKKLS